MKQRPGSPSPRVSPAVSTPAHASSGSPPGTGTGEESSNAPSVRLGIEAAHLAPDHPTTLICHDLEARRYLSHPAFQADLARCCGGRLVGEREDRPSEVDVPVDTFEHHGFVFGATGMGKTCLIFCLLIALVSLGHSALILDVKGELLALVLAWAAASGLAPERVHLWDPRRPELPGWNPLIKGLPSGQAVADLVHLLERSFPTTGPRMREVMMNSLVFIGSLPAPSIYEMRALLLYDQYRKARLREPAHPADVWSFRESVTYLRDVLGNWSPSERIQSITPVLHRLEELLRNPFLRSLLCARRNTLDLASLWRKQALVLVRLDPAVLGLPAAEWLASLLVSQIYATAQRAPGPVPLLLACDELSLLERLVGHVLARIVAAARSQNLRLLLACQYLAQLSEQLRESLLANAGFLASFRLGHTDARVLAASLAAGTVPSLSRLTVGIERPGREMGPPRSEWRHPIRDARGRPLRVNRALWPLFPRHARGRTALRGLREFMRLGPGSRLYVCAPDTGRPVELGRYVAGLPDDCFWVEGPDLRLVLRLPVPRVTGAERSTEADWARAWTGCLQALPRQHAVIRVGGGATRVVRIVDVPAARVDPDRLDAFAAAAMAANAQRPAEIEANLRRRQEAVEELALGQLGTWQETEEEDDSIA